MKHLIRVTAFAVCTALAAPVGAQSNQDGMNAYRAGDYSAALEIFRPLAENGDAIAQSSLGLMYFHGRGVPQNYAAAMRWYRLAAAQGNALAQQRLDRLEALLQDADIETVADFSIGLHAYNDGDFTAAIANWRPLAEQGNADAQRNLGIMYVFGEGVLRDYSEAAHWFRLAAEQGDDHAQFALGSMYSNGDGVPQNNTEAAHWYWLAAEQGNADAQNSLGYMYQHGQSVLQDYEAAGRWYWLAAEQGHVDAQRNLGNMYQLVQDYVSAHMWYNIASANGDESSGWRRDSLADEMTPDQVADAQARARVCMASDYQDCN